jgi:hypothetical protein
MNPYLAELARAAVVFGGCLGFVWLIRRVSKRRTR